MAPNNSIASRFPEPTGSGDPFTMQLALSRDHARLVPMLRVGGAYEIHPDAEDWLALPAARGFAGYGLGRALRMLLDVLRGLTALHDTFATSGEPFTHGEVALVNFRIDAEGVCRLVPLTHRHSAESEPEPPVATIGYLAPERLLGERLDARADVFSAGVLLWEALAGCRLFAEDTAEAIIDRLMGGKLQMPQLPPELAWAIPLKSVAARALAVDPYQRFSDCAELATAIAIVARERIATHAELTSFFGTAIPSFDPRPRHERPIPTQSSTFSAVDAPASGRRSTLAPLGPSSSRPPPPVTPIGAAHKSPFRALLLRQPAALPVIAAPPALTAPAARPDIESSFPAFSTEVAAPRSTLRPPPLPIAAVPEPVPLSVPAPDASASPASTLSAVAVALPALVDESEPKSAETVRPARSRRLWLAFAICAVGAAGAVAMLGHWNAAATRPAPAPLATAALARTPALVAAPSEPEPFLSASSASPARDMPNNVSAPHAIQMHAAPRVPKSAAKARSTKAKDYGI
jgi:serine/threonine-protein kinase